MPDFLLAVLAGLARLVFCFGAIVFVALALLGTISQMRDAAALRRGLSAGWASTTPG